MGIDTVSDLPRRNQYVAAVSQDEFDYTFPIFSDADLVVDVDGVTQALDTDYTVAGETDDTGGTITFATPLSGGEIVTIYSELEIARTTDFQQNGPWSSESTNDQLDRLTIISRELRDQIHRCLRIPMTAAVPSADIEFEPLANWLSKYVFIGADGTPEPASLVEGTISASVIGTHLYPQSAAEIAIDVAPTHVQYPVGDIRRYGASAAASGTTNITAIQTAINVVKQQGHGVIKLGPERYNLGTFATTGITTLIVSSDLKNAVFDFGGGELFMTITDNDAHVNMLLLINPLGITFKQPRFVVAGAVAPIDAGGPGGLHLAVNDDDTTEVGNVVLEQPYFEGLTASLFVTQSTESTVRRFRGIRMYGGNVESCYYGPSFQQAGDDFKGDWRCHNVRRGYFAYGVRGHRGRASICNDLANFTADACVLIASQPQSDTDPAPEATQDIHIDATFRGDVSSWGSLVTFYQVGANAPQTIRDCSAFLNLTDVSNIALTRPFLFKSHVSSGGAEETTTTQNIWKGIHIDALASEVTVAAMQYGMVEMRVSPDVPADIILGPGLRNAFTSRLDQTDLTGLKTNNWLFYTGPRRFMKIKTGDLTAAPMTIEMASRDGLGFSLRLRILARANIGVLAGQSVTYEDIIVTGYRAGGGAAAISQQDTLLTHSTGTPTVITVAASGTTLTIAFTDYNHANARAIVDCELLWPVAETLG